MALFTPTLQLGDFDFVSFELPTAITFGKEQELYKHILIGGGRVIDAMGAGDPDITWSGYFTGFQAVDRAKFIEGLVKAGQPLLLTASTVVKNVVIKNFTWGLHDVWPISYTITVQVINDLTLPVTFLVPGDLTQTVLQYLVQAEDLATLVNNPSVSSALALALIAAQNAAPFSTASNAQITAALSAAQNAQSAVGVAIASTETAIFGT